MLPSFGKAQKIKAKEKLKVWKKQQAEKKAYEEQKEEDRLKTIQNANDKREKRAAVSFKPSCLNLCMSTLNILLHDKSKQTRLHTFIDYLNLIRLRI